ncbi:MAG: nuclear transport factor 2 family protein [Woeseiaceae bacterium]
MTITAPVHAEPSAAFVSAFIAASEQARQPAATTEDLDAFLAFLADDVTDHHIAYARSFEGTAHLKKGIPQKVASMVSIAQDIESIILGSNTAVVVVNERSEYYRNETLRQYEGRTILILRFDEEGLINEIRRYLD